MVIIYQYVTVMAAGALSSEESGALPMDTANGDDEIEHDNLENETSGQQNGSSVREIDRFGFFGGNQYTDPNQYVTLNLVILCVSTWPKC